MKKLLMLLVLISASLGLWAQSITLNSLSIQKDGGGGSVVNGDLVRIRTVFDVGSLSSFTGNFGVSYGPSDRDKIAIRWFDSSNEIIGPDVLVSTSGAFTSTIGASNDLTDITFILPVPPSGAVTMDIGGRIYGDAGFGNYVHSAGKYSTDNGSYHATLDVSSDTGTQAPTISAPATGSTINQNFALNFNLPEAAQTGSVKITFFNTGGISDSFTREFRYDDETSGDKSLAINGFDIASTADLVRLNGSANELVYGSEYSIKVEYQDALGNPTASDIVLDILYENSDTETEDPTLTAPAASSTINRDFDLIFELPEAAKAGSVEISFTRSSGSADGNNHLFYYVGDLDAEGNIPSGTRTLALDGLDISAHANLNIDSASSDALVYGAVYTVRVYYQDIYENPVAFARNLSVTFENEDSITEEPTLVAPTSNSIINNSFDLQFSLPEAAYAGSVKLSFVRTSGSSDTDDHIFIYNDVTASTHTLSNVDATDIGSHPNLSRQTGSSSSLVSGAYYDIVIQYQDAYQNPIATDSNINVLYAADYIQLDGGDYNVGASFNPGSVNNAFFQLSVVKTGTGTSVISAIEFDLLGTYDLADLDNVKLWSYASDNFDAGSAILLATKTSVVDPLAFTGLSVGVSSTTKYLYLTADIAEGADTSSSIGASITSNNDVTANIPVYGAPINGGDHALPVTLSSFQAVQENNTVLLSWVTASESNNSHWNIYRSPSANFGQAQKLNAAGIEAAGFSSQPVHYSFQDLEGLAYDNEYWYWIEAVAFNGLSEVMEPILLAFDNPSQDDYTPEIPLEFGLYQNSPNPFNPDTMISFALEENAAADLAIYNVKGQKIQTLYQGQVAADKVHSVWWDGKDSSGKSVSSGVYFYILKTSIGNFSQKMLLTK